MSRDFIHDWAANVLNRPRDSIGKEVRATLVYRAHPGAMTWYVALDVLAQPSEQFSVTVHESVEAKSISLAAGWFDELVYGIIEGLATLRFRPVFGVHVQILDVALRPPDPAPPTAFRMAGRQAAREILEAVSR